MRRLSLTSIQFDVLSDILNPVHSQYRCTVGLSASPTTSIGAERAIAHFLSSLCRWVVRQGLSGSLIELRRAFTSSQKLSINEHPCSVSTALNVLSVTCKQVESRTCPISSMSLLLSVLTRRDPPAHPQPSARQSRPTSRRTSVADESCVS